MFKEREREREQNNGEEWRGGRVTRRWQDGEVIQRDNQGIFATIAQIFKTLRSSPNVSLPRGPLTVTEPKRAAVRQTANCIGRSQNREPELFAF